MPAAAHARGARSIVIGVANLLPGASARNVAANVTLVREGAGSFYSTQGDDKCALDEVRQEPVDGRDGRYRVSARGYCTQPARALGAAMHRPSWLPVPGLAVKAAVGELAEYLLHGRRVVPARLRALGFAWKHPELAEALAAALAEQ